MIRTLSGSLSDKYRLVLPARKFIVELDENEREQQVSSPHRSG